jgi:hypothetical protein
MCTNPLTYRTLVVAYIRSGLQRVDARAASSPLQLGAGCTRTRAEKAGVAE